uniref:Reverse transcriptase domain-containing protein n=1 Tax=Clytia hemisphaerica TaxID=252671 RepID=A0A7M5V1C4_9CNID
MMYSFDEDPAALEDVFRNELWDFVSIFTDDIFIYSDTFEKHLEHIQTIFKRLRDAGLKTKRKKCHFCVPVLNFLGHEVSAEGIKPKVDNVRKLLDAKKPKTTKEVQSFLGLTDYYRRVVPGYSEIARPLYKCIPKFQWGGEQDKAWQTLIERLTNPPLFESPDFNKEFILNTDASGLAFGYVLSQTSGDDKPHLIRYGGRVLRNAEIPYTISEIQSISRRTFLHNIYGSSTPDSCVAIPRFEWTLVQMGCSASEVFFRDPLQERSEEQ